jgi:hypothetical protein
VLRIDQLAFSQCGLLRVIRCLKPGEMPQAIRDLCSQLGIAPE